MFSEESILNSQLRHPHQNLSLHPPKAHNSHLEPKLAFFLKNSNQRLGCLSFPSCEFLNLCHYRNCFLHLDRLRMKVSVFRNILLIFSQNKYYEIMLISTGKEILLQGSCKVLVSFID